MAEPVPPPRRRPAQARRLTVVLAVLLVAGLWLPMLQMMVRFVPESGLNGYSPPLDPPPADLRAAWFDRRFQRWSEAYLGGHIGFRFVLVRTYNQVAFGLFGGLPQLEVVEVPPGELIYRRHVMSLNDTVLKREALRQEYARRAQRALLAQQVLARNGSHLLMLIVPSKGGSYPDKVPRRFLARDAETLLKTGIHYGDVLAEAGVDVIDFSREFRDLRQHIKLPLDAPYGVHWNFYAGCLAAQRMVEHLATVSGVPLAGVNCDPAMIETAHSTDIDGLNLLNLWRPERHLTPLPYPTVKAVSRPGATQPRMLFIGDSFSDQIRSALSLAGTFKEASFASYFATLRKVSMGEDLNKNPVTPIDRGAFDFAPDGEPYRFIVIQSVDYNLNYKDFGFFDTVLTRLLPPLIANHPVDARDPAAIAPMLVSGWAAPDSSGVRVEKWPATLAFQVPQAAGQRRLTLRLNVPDDSVAPQIRSGDQVLPAVRQSLGTEGVSAGDGHQPHARQIVLTSELPIQAAGSDPITTISLSPVNVSTGDATTRAVILTGLLLE